MGDLGGDSCLGVTMGFIAFLSFLGLEIGVFLKGSMGLNSECTTAPSS